MKKNYSSLYLTKNNKFLKGLFLTITLLFFGNSINAQITVTNTGNATPALATTYTTLNAALTQLSLATSFSGPVVITVDSSSYTETAPVGGFVISYSAATSSATNNVIIDGNGASFTAAAGLTTSNYNDAIIKIKGSDFITIQNFKLYENANVSAADLLPSSNKMTEWGIALLYKTTTDGCQNITLKNNTIDLNKNYINAIGIYANAAHVDSPLVAALSTTPVSATTTAGGNNNLTIIQNTITDVNQGIVVSGPIAAADFNNILTIGGSAINANTITNFGTANSVVANGLPSGITISTISGIYVKNTINYNVSFNNINNLNTLGVSTVSAGTLRAIYVPAFSLAPTQTNIVNNINSNTITLKTNVNTSIIGLDVQNTTSNATPVTGSTINIKDNIFSDFNNTLPAATGQIFVLNHASTSLNVTISGNQFRNMAFTTSGNCTLINNSNLSTNYIVTANKICDNAGSTSSATPLLTKTAGGTFSGYSSGGAPTAGTATIADNNFSNIALTGATTFYGIKYNPTTALASIAQKVVIDNNTITNITVGSNPAFGISKNGGTAASTINKNVIGNFTNTTGTGNITGIVLDEITPGLGATCAANKIYDLIANVTTTATVNGIFYTQAGTGTNFIFNNFIGSLKSTAFTSATSPYIGVSGIYLFGTSPVAGVTHKLFNNTIYIPAGTSSGTNFTSNCVFMGNNTNLTSLVMQNNLLVNLSTASGLGKAVAFQKDATVAITKYTTPSNNNSLWGTSGLYWDGTTVATTIAAYKSAVVSPKDLASINTNPTFDSLDGTNNKFLHLSDGAGGATTLLESGGTTAANAGTSGANAATPDLDGDARPGPVAASNGGGSSYDIGADEFDGIPAKPVVTLVSTTAGIGDPCITNLSRTITVAVLNNGALRAVNPVQLTYYFNGVLQGTISPTTAGSSAANANTNWIFDLPAATISSTTVTWTITATEDITLVFGTLSGTYRDQSTSSITATATSSSATICAGGSTTLTATFASSYIETGTVAPATVTNPTIEEDISNVTISQGAATIFNNTSARNNLAGTIGAAAAGSTAGSYADYTGFGTPAGSGYPVKAGGVYNFSLSSIVSTATSTNAFAIYIDYNKNGVLETSEKVYASGSATTNGHTETGTFTIPTTAAGGKTRMRVIVKQGNPVTSGTLDPVYGEFEDYTLNIAPYFSTFSWNYGAATGTFVASTNPALITGASAGTYFITATDAYGCTVQASVSIAGSALMSNPVFAIPSSYAVCNATVNVSTDVTGGCAPLTYSWTATGPAGSVMTFSDPTAATPTFGGSLSGNYTLTCVISDFSGDTRTATHTTPIVISNPTPTVTGGPYSLCGAGTLSLTASKSSPANVLNWYDSNAVGAAAIGSGSPFVSPTISATTTYYVEEGIGGPATGVTGTGTSIISSATGGNGLTPFSGRYETQHTQYLITAADMTAAGLTSGNITAMSLNVAAKNSSHTTNYVDYTIKMGSAGTTTALTGFLAPTFTTVYGPTTYTTVLGTNPFPFSSNYNWNGVDNIVLDVCFANDLTSLTGNGISWSFNDSVTGTDKFLNVTFGNFQDNSSLCGTTGGTIATSTFLPDFTFSGQAISCRGAKVAVPITFIPPPDLTLSSNITLCNDAVGMIKATTPVGNFTNYSWSPTTNLWVDAAGSATPYTGQNTDTVYVRGTTAGTQIYTLTGINGTCTNKATVTVVIMPQPTITSSASSYCVSGTPTLSLSPATGYTGGAIQWKSATALGGPYTSISGANAAIYTPITPITTTTYFQAVILNSALGSCTAIAPVVINVDSPAITSNIPATRCGTGTVNLSAVSSTGVVKWYAAATGGTSLFTGSTFTTPTIAATKNYYVEAASSPLGGTYDNLGNTATPTTTGFTVTRGIVFSASQSGTILSAQYYSPTLNVTNNITVTLVNNATGTVLNTVPLSIAQGSTAGFYTMNLNLAVTAGTTYRLLASFSQSVNRIDTGADYTNTAFNNLAPLGVITSGYENGISNTSYNYFHNILVSIGCNSNRVAVTATVSPPPSLSLSSSSAILCAGTPAAAITLTSAAANFDTYVWSPATGVTGDATAGWVFNPSLSAVYTLTASQSSGALCANTATVAVTVNPLPALLAINPTTTFSCPGKAQLISVTPPVNVSIIESFDNPSSLFDITQTSGTFSTTQSGYFAEGTAAVLFNTTSNSSNAAYQMTSSIDLTTTRNPVLTFKHICATEAGFDYGFVQYSVDGGATWTSFPASSYSGGAVLKNGVVSFDRTSYTDWGTTFTATTSNPGTAPASSLWKAETLTIPTAAMSSTQFKVRFRLTIDFSNIYYGWLIDDFKLIETNPANLIWSATPYIPLYIDNLAAPNPYDPAIHINQALIYAKPIVNTVVKARVTYLSGCFSDSNCTITTNDTVTYSGGSWLGGLTPVAGKAIVFDSGTYNSTTDLQGCSCTVNSGANVTINGNLVLENNLAVDPLATMTFSNNASLIQINNPNNPSAAINPPNTGKIIYKRTTSTLANNYDFVYWGSPVKDQIIGNIWMNTTGLTDAFYYFDPLSVTAADPYLGWIDHLATGTMTPGKGYISRARSGASGWTPGTTWTANFNGIPNNGTVTYALKINGTISKDNLIANPYPSAIDIIAFQNDLGNNNRTTKNYYFWSHFTPYTGTVYQTDDYSVFNGTVGAGVGTAPINNPTGQAPDRYVPAGQAFFVEATGNLNVSFKNAHRVSSNNTDFYRTAQKTTASTSDFVRSDKLWLNLSNQQGIFKQFLIAYADGATNEYDLFYEAKSQDGNSFADFYTTIPNNKFVIQSRAPFVANDLVAIGYKTMVAGNYWINIDHADALFANNQKVYLQDNLLQIDHDLSASPYKFSTETGEFNERFVLKYKSYLPTLPANGVIVANTKQSLNIRSLLQNIEKITVYDLLGRMVYEKEGIHSKNFADNKVVLNTQTLIVKITLDNDEVVTHKILFE
jgi:hypothetical protein